MSSPLYDPRHNLFLFFLAGQIFCLYFIAFARADRNVTTRFQKNDQLSYFCNFWET